MKRILLTMLLLSAVLGYAAAQTSTAITKEERNAVRKGNSYYEQGNFAKALENYEVALKLNPGSNVAAYDKALALLNMAPDVPKDSVNRPRQEAMELFERVGNSCLHTDSTLAEKAFYNLGNMAYNDEDYARSIERYKQALRINPDNNRTRQNLRMAQLKQKEQQNQDKQDQDKQDQDKQDQQQQQQQEQEQQQQQQQQQQQPMTQSAEQILQAMQNKENATRRKQKEPVQPGRYSTDKPW